MASLAVTVEASGYLASEGTETAGLHPDPPLLRGSSVVRESELSVWRGGKSQKKREFQIVPDWTD